ncbi:MAG: hypothetical protein IKU32_00105 [Clostridia bacterium]|nr:hypothetical protein [Clostridia bacterium]
MQYDVDMNAMKAYIIEKFKAEGDFDFLKEGLLEEMVSEMLSLDQAYMAKLSEDDEYDDDDVYDILFSAMQKKYPDYKMFAMRLAEDYLDFAEEYLVSVDAIEWD